MVSLHCKDKRKVDIKIGQVKKPIANLCIKEKDMRYNRKLKLSKTCYDREKIHRVLELKQLQWLKPYIASGTYSNELMNVKNIFSTSLTTVFWAKPLKTKEM